MWMHGGGSANLQAANEEMGKVVLLFFFCILRLEAEGNSGFIIGAVLGYIR